MSWMGRLCETYDYAIQKGAAFDDKNPLPEISFKIENVQAVVMLTNSGEFYDVVMIPKEEQSIFVPATYESITARGAPVQPHPIFDKVKELCTDNQLDILAQWCAEDDVPNDVKIVYKYLSDKSLYNDVKNAFEQKKIVDKPETVFVRFKIATELYNNTDFIKSWKSHFVKHYFKHKHDLCYVTGENTTVAVKHPFASGTTMLISMVDANCAGRFESRAEEAVSVGIEATLKMHNTRRWLMNRQGRYIYGMEIVAWDTIAFSTVDPFDADNVFDGQGDEIDTGEVESGAISSAAGGFRSPKLDELNSYSFNELSTMVIMAIDSANGKGRTSLVYYQEFEPHDYISNLMNWYSGCIWRIYGNKTDRYYSFTPNLLDICGLYYGNKNDEGAKKLKKQLCKELIPCIIAKKPLPSNLIPAGFNRVINPLSFKSYKSEKWSRTEWNKALNILCALINKSDTEKGLEPKMELDQNETNRDYLYGRLLAIADTIEQIAMTESDNSRQTNAMRYMQRFAQRPAETWVMLRTQKLIPYLNRLKPSSRVFYERLICGVESLMSTDSYNSSKPLGPRFLQGYSCQKTFKKSDSGEHETPIK